MNPSNILGLGLNSESFSHNQGNPTNADNTLNQGDPSYDSSHPIRPNVIYNEEDIPDHTEDDMMGDEGGNQDEDKSEVTNGVQYEQSIAEGYEDQIR